ncbi:hypothetical protein PHMEG_00027757 [Phytophthora megakarya]|uniref:Uncharacterized protein n=1 Tax=Phytophthora megakarya TaxID=4795 RepID=A0A225V7L3_9STRA|nr:hypothetical protein PHMEG_00027757 [Phytophthora megakarya]
MTAFLNDHGVRLLKTDSYTPEEYVLLEKLNGLLMDKVRVVQEATGLLEAFRMPSIYGHVIVLRSPASRKIKIEQAESQNNTHFLGYAQTSLEYRLLDFRSCNLVEQRDARFREDITVDSDYLPKLFARR